MSKICTLLGGLVAIGTLAALVIGGFSTASSTGAQSSKFRADAISPACVFCVGGEAATTDAS